ncbi:MAG: YqgE/AlgH family protein [Pseudomonadota bacterium]
MRTDHAHTLRGHLLIATTGLRDSMFRRSVVFLCAHSPAGAMGLMINRPTQDVSWQTLLPNLKPMINFRLENEPIYEGGPAQTQRGFVLHSPEYIDGQETLRIGDGFAMTTGDRILRDMVSGRGPSRRLVAMGYAGWGAGQLDSELRENAWFTVAAKPDLVFGAPDDAKWRGAIAAIGIDSRALSGLSAQHGHA